MKNNTIILYATMSCPYCKMEHNWLEENKIEHKLVFVDLNPFEAQKMVKKTGQMGVPVTEINYENGNVEYVIGFDKDHLSEVLGISK